MTDYCRAIYCFVKFPRSPELALSSTDDLLHKRIANVTFIIYSCIVKHDIHLSNTNRLKTCNPLLLQPPMPGCKGAKFVFFMQYLRSNQLATKSCRLAFKHWFRYSSDEKLATVPTQRATRRWPGARIQESPSRAQRRVSVAAADAACCEQVLVVAFISSEAGVEVSSDVRRARKFVASTFKTVACVAVRWSEIADSISGVLLMTVSSPSSLLLTTTGKGELRLNRQRPPASRNRKSLRAL